VQHLKSQIGRELDRLELLLGQIKAVEAERDALLTPATETEGMLAPQAMLIDLRGIGAEFAAVVWSEGSAGASPTEGRSRPTAGWRRRPGRADPSRASKACPKPAIRGCGQR
jgi:transposase